VPDRDHRDQWRGFDDPADINCRHCNSETRPEIPPPAEPQRGSLRGRTRRLPAHRQKSASPFQVLGSRQPAPRVVR
jgi:hypothetical protein